jgi:hypothetical protein
MDDTGDVEQIEYNPHDEGGAEEPKAKADRRRKSRLEHEKRLALINEWMIREPRLAEKKSIPIFIELVAKKFSVSFSMARKDINRVFDLRRKAAEVDAQYELGRILDEINALMARALEQGNLNAYVGALHERIELLGLRKLVLALDVHKNDALWAAALSTITDSLSDEDKALLKGLGDAPPNDG